jgi:hypothetical protein
MCEEATEGEAFANVAKAIIRLSNGETYSDDD